MKRADKPEASPVDWHDRDQLRRFFSDLSAVIDDEIAIAEDQMRPLRERDVGPREAARVHREAVASIRALLSAGEAGLVLGSRAKRGAP